MARTNPKLGNTHVPDILRFEIAPGETAYRRITIQLREVILSKALPPGTRLPTLAELARLWKTNYFTVQTALTPLVNQGLLMRKQRRGTYVAEITPQIKTVGIYFGASFWQVRDAAFYRTLYVALRDHFERLGITVHLFMDPRPREQQGTPWKVLTDAVECREVNAVISAMTTSEEVSWLEELPVPLTMIGGATYHSVDIGLSNLLRSSLVRLKERKCRSVALISGGGMTDYETFQKMAKEIGLKTRREWSLLRDTWTEEFEEFGFDSFSKIWKGATKPDGLIVFPDNIAPGVIMAILQQGAKVPEQLKLVMHCNEEVYVHCPLAADWQVISIVKIVEALWKNLCAQADGETPEIAVSCLTIQPETAGFPPMRRKWKSGASLFEQS